MADPWRASVRCRRTTPAGRKWVPRGLFPGDPLARITIPCVSPSLRRGRTRTRSRSLSSVSAQAVRAAPKTLQTKLSRDPNGFHTRAHELVVLDIPELPGVMLSGIPRPLARRIRMRTFRLNRLRHVTASRTSRGIHARPGAPSQRRVSVAAGRSVFQWRAHIAAVEASGRVSGTIHQLRVQLRYCWAQHQADSPWRSSPLASMVLHAIRMRLPFRRNRHGLAKLFK